MIESRHKERQYMKLAMHVGLLYVRSGLGPMRDLRRAGQTTRADSVCCLHYLLAVDSGRQVCASLYEAGSV